MECEVPEQIPQSGIWIDWMVKTAGAAEFYMKRGRPAAGGSRCAMPKIAGDDTIFEDLEKR